MDTAELNNALKQRMEEVVSFLYPAAKIKGNIAHLGSVGGDPGDSFNIFVSGPRVGCFIDRANPRSEEHTSELQSH